jgi:hypothetical protein
LAIEIVAILSSLAAFIMLVYAYKKYSRGTTSTFVAYAAAAAFFFTLYKTWEVFVEPLPGFEDLDLLLEHLSYLMGALFLALVAVRFNSFLKEYGFRIK